MSLGGTDLIIRRPTDADIDFLIENIREADAIEIKAICGKTVREAVRETPDIYNNAWAWEADQKIMCIFGVNPLLDKLGEGVVWLLGSKFFDNNRMVFACVSKAVFRDTIKDFKHIFNCVHSENVRSIRWLKWLGFAVDEAKPVEINGARFFRFEMWR